MWEPLPLAAPEPARAARHDEVGRALRATLCDEPDWVAAMSTVACELHHAFAYFHWTGFYRWMGGELVVGPYQGGHGCLRIPLGRGICGAAARLRQTQLVPDVRDRPDHIACASSTRSEIVVPVLREADAPPLAVLDVDSDHLNAFSEADRRGLEALCAWLGRRYG